MEDRTASATQSERGKSLRGAFGGHTIYYVALPFTRFDGGLAPGEAVECHHAAAAIRRAQAMSCNEANEGAVAFSRQDDSNVGEFEDAVILKMFGEVPDDLSVVT